MKLISRFKRLSLWNKVGFVGALASVAGIPLAIVLSQFQDEQDIPIVEHSLQALALLHARRFPESAKAFDQVLAQNPTDSSLWEGKAYAHLGIAYSNEFNLEVFWGNFDLAPKTGGEVAIAVAHARKALETAKSDEQRARANLALGLALQLAGYDDYGASRHGLAPLDYYLEAARLNALLDGRLSAPIFVRPIRHTPYHEVINYAVTIRLDNYYSAAACLAHINKLKGYPELLQKFSPHCERHP